jgi:hypothetical protein
VADSGLFLFVSHVSEDRPAVIEIVEELERRGIRCWIALRDVRPTGCSELPLQKIGRVTRQVTREGQCDSTAYLNATANA